ncbi:MAG: hypothetical protein EA403_11015 [Spirochaetaceae bacterium]|nr:MAG: hypothetical protein EA403_11015 [Spirochaetaceae bacterium]
MSFYCRYLVDRDHCSRRDLTCRPGAEGCVLHGKVVMAADVPSPPTATRKPKRSTSTPPPPDQRPR